MEANEIEELENEMHEGAEASMKHVSLIISVLAVLVAMVTVLGHREHTEAVLMQSRAADQWNEYQAHKIRLHEDSLALDQLSVEPANSDGSVKLRTKYSSEMEKWQKETDEDSEKAKDFGAEVKLAEAKAGRFDLSEALLEIAVVLASITLLTRREHYVVMAVVLGLAGLVLAASAFLVK